MNSNDAAALEQVNRACDLINNGIEKIRQAQEMLLGYGINVISRVDTDKIYENTGIEHNIHLYSGITQFGQITGETARFVRTESGLEVNVLKHRGLVFLQLASSGEVLDGM